MGEELLVNEPRNEYMVDRLRAEIRALELRLVDLQLEHDVERSRAMVAEIMLCLISGITGYALGVWLA